MRRKELSGMAVIKFEWTVEWKRRRRSSKEKERCMRN